MDKDYIATREWVEERLRAGYVSNGFLEDLYANATITEMTGCTMSFDFEKKSITVKNTVTTSAYDSTIKPIIFRKYLLGGFKKLKFKVEQQAEKGYEDKSRYVTLNGVNYYAKGHSEASSDGVYTVDFTEMLDDYSIGFHPNAKGTVIMSEIELL